MKRYLYLFLVLSIVSIGYCAHKVNAMPNPWIDCEDDIYCGAKKAGFNLPVRVNDYSVRAMKGLLQISFPLDKKRTVIMRKSQTYDDIFDSNGVMDISGDYNEYPVNKTIYLKNTVPFNVRGQKNKFIVANFASETGYYSFYCKQGLTVSDLHKLYKLLEEAEAPRNIDDETSNYTIDQLRNLRRADGIVEPVYTQDCFPRTLQKKGVTKDCFERANLGQDTACSASEIKMIKEYYKKGYKKDPLNNGCGEFCAK